MSDRPVLVITTDEDLQQALKGCFDADGWSTNVVDDRSEAAKAIAYRSYELVVAECDGDINDADEVIRTIKERNSGAISIILLSNEPMEVSEVLGLGADAVLSSEVDPRAVFCVARRLLISPEERGKRRDERIACEFPVLFKDPLSQQSISARVLNLSESGLFIQFESKSLPGRFDVVSFVFRMEQKSEIHAESDSKSLEISGKGLVRWVRPDAPNPDHIGFGLEFFDLSSGGQEAISRWTKANTPPPMELTLDE